MKVQFKKQLFYKQIVKLIFLTALNFIILSSIACQDRLIVLWDEPSFLLVCDTSICPNPQTIYLGDSTTLTLESPRVDQNDPKISWTVLDGPGGETWNPPGQNAVLQNFTPDAIGTYEMQVNYEVFGGTCSCDFTVTVDPPSCDTSICPGDVSVVVGEKVQLDIAGVNPGANDINWTILNGPGSGTWDPSGQDSITEGFTPDTPGTYNMQVSYDLYGQTCSCNFTITVNPSSCDTGICPGNVNIAIGEKASMDIVGVDPAATNIDWTILSGPGSGTWSPSGQNAVTQSFTPDTPGTYNMQVSYDLYGQTCSCKFKINVDSGPCDESICPASTSMYAGDNITLDIKGVDSGATNIKWQLLNPYGGEIWNPSAQNAITEVFTPYIIGLYKMKVSYKSYGQTCTCNFNLDVQLDPDQFRIELTWDGKGDVDLHLNHPSMSDPMTGKWETNKDCYYINPKTSWGASLDVDNTNKNGPENIVLNSNIAPKGKYHIGIANFSHAEGRVATVKIYCDSNKPEVYKSRALKIDDFWILGSIDPDNCKINKIDKYRVYTGNRNRKSKKAREDVDLGCGSILSESE